MRLSTPHITFTFPNGRTRTFDLRNFNNPSNHSFIYEIDDNGGIVSKEPLTIIESQQLNKTFCYFMQKW